MDFIPFIALGVSIFALIISALSLWNSWRTRRSSEDAQLHNQTVSFEQRKQQVRQTIFETQLRLGEISNHLNRAERKLSLLEGEDALRIEVIKTHSDMITDVAAIRSRGQAALKAIIEMPSSPSTPARVTLEEIGGISDQLDKRVQGLFQQTQDVLKILDRK